MTNYQKSYRNKPLERATTAAERLVGDFGLDPSLTKNMATQLRRSMLHGHMGSKVVRYAERKDNERDVGGDGKASLGSTLLTVASKIPFQGPGAPAPAKIEPDYKKNKKGDIQFTKIPPTAVKLTRKKSDQPETQLTLFGDLSEKVDTYKKCNCKGKCTCDECNCKDECTCGKRLKKYIKEKYLNQHTTQITENSDISTKTITNFSNIDFTKFLGKKVLAETVEGSFYGTLGTSKSGVAIYKNGILQTSLDESKLLKFVCDDAKYVFKFPINDFLQEKIVHRGGKFLVTNKAGTKVLGTHSTEKSAEKQLQAIHISQAKHVHESSELLLKENIRNRFFAEEIVHSDHEHTMTDDDIYERDQIADQILSGKGKWKKAGEKLKNKEGETREEAAHRLATYIVVCKRRKGGGGGYEKGLFHGDNQKDSRRKVRSGRHLVKRDKTEEGRRKKETIKDKRGRKVTRNVIKPGQKGVIKTKHKKEAEELRRKKKAIPAEFFRKTANLSGAGGTTRSQFGKLRAANDARRNAYKR